MNRVLTMVRSLATLPSAILKWMHSNIIEPEGAKEPLPPIRYDDDPSEIYLA